MAAERGTEPWGKLLGGALGLVMGGPLGATLGVLLGHSVDSGLRPLLRGVDLARLQRSFLDTVFQLAGYLAKADGRVSSREIASAERLMQRMRLDRKSREHAISQFNLGRAPGFQPHAVLASFRALSEGQGELRRLMIEALIETALADGRLKSEGAAGLRLIAAELDIAEDELLAMLELRSPGQGAIPEPYRVLGLGADASNDEVRQAYRRLMARNHPDKLVSRGLPQEMMKLAEDKTRQIRWAYEQIRGERGW